MEPFPSVGMEISIEIQMGMEIYFPAQKNASGMVYECKFFNSISNRDKIIGQFPIGVEILGFFSTGDDFWPIFPVERGIHRVRDTGVYLA